MVIPRNYFSDTTNSSRQALKTFTHDDLKTARYALHHQQIVHKTIYIHIADVLNVCRQLRQTGLRVQRVVQNGAKLNMMKASGHGFEIILLVDTFNRITPGSVFMFDTPEWKIK